MARGLRIAMLALLVSLAGCAWLDEKQHALALRPTPGQPDGFAGLRSGDWVRALADERGEWRDVQSRTDRMWELTQSALQRQVLRLQVSDAEGRGARTLTLDLSEFDPRTNIFTSNGVVLTILT